MAKRIPPPRPSRQSAEFNKALKVQSDVADHLSVVVDQLAAVRRNGACVHERRILDASILGTRLLMEPLRRGAIVAGPDVAKLERARERLPHIIRMLDDAAFELATI